MKKALIIVVVLFVFFWFLAGLIISCDKFVFLPDGEHQEGKCVCFGRKIQFMADPNEVPGSYGTKCVGFRLW